MRPPRRRNSSQLSADITPEMPKLCRVTKVNVFFLVLVYVLSFDLFEFSSAILEKALLLGKVRLGHSRLSNDCLISNREQRTRYEFVNYGISNLNSST